MMSATGAAEEIPARLDAVANDFATTVFARRGEGMDGALETIKVMRNPIYDDFE